MAALSKAFFTPPLPEDEASVKAWHAAQRAQGGARGLSEEELQSKGESFWRRRCRVSTRPAAEMVAELDKVMETFSQPGGPGFDRATSLVVTTGDTQQVHENVKQLVEAGHVCGEYWVLFGSTIFNKIWKIRGT